MPNIMFIGFTETEYEAKKPVIDNILQGLGLGDKAVTTFFPGSKAESCDGRRTRMPYIRVCSTDPIEQSRVVETLQRRGFCTDTEIETMLVGFKSSEEMAGDL